MIERQKLYNRRCVASLIQVIEQVPLRAAVRRPLTIQCTSVGLLLLWSILRWERTFAIQTLERLNIDIWSLTRDVDEALNRCSEQAQESGTWANSDYLDPLLGDWLDQAVEQARILRHDFLGGEHLLLALLADTDPELTAIFRQSGLTYDLLKQAVVAAFGAAAAPHAIVLDAAASSPVETSAKLDASRWIADIDRPAIGVPRRFGVFLMMLMVTLYAVLFSLLTMLRASTLVFVLLALLFTGIGIGQAVLFGGRYPRAASIWVGSILVPIEVCVWGMCQAGALYHGSLRGVEILLAIFIFCIPFGAVFGYLFGTLTAGGFWLVDWYEKRHTATDESSAD